MVSHENMSVDEVTPMAKTKTTTKSSSPKAATKTAVKKAAPKKAAAPKSDAKTAAPKKTAAKAAAPKSGGVKKAAPKKAAVKLTDAQANLLKEVIGTKEAGLVASKKIQKQLDSLQAKKLIKRGKKEGAFYKYHGTKLGEKHQASTGSSESSPSAAS
jgi:hypothetical protein